VTLGDQPVDRFRVQLEREGLFPGEDTVLEDSEPSELFTRSLSRMHAAIVVDGSSQWKGSGSDLWTTRQWGS
jgi:hypothetical protein